MRRILTLACLPLAFTGCKSGERHVSGPPPCVSRVIWQGTVYYGNKFPSRLPATLILGTGGLPTCGDVNGGEAGASSIVEVRRLAGVDPRVAVAIRGEPDVAYLARGYFVQLPSHPLHQALSRSERSRSELKGCAETRPLTFKGTVRSSNGATIGVSRGRREAFLFVDAYTRVRGLERNGLPYVPLGPRISVRATACLWPDGRLRKLVPRLIAGA